MPARNFPWKIRLAAWLGVRSWGIRLKLSLITLSLIALTTFGSSLVVISTMNGFLLDSLIKRGSSIALSAASPAGFSLLSNDRLALDNLVAKIKESQADIAYMTIVDHHGAVLAHDRLAEVGLEFPRVSGPLVHKEEEFSVREVLRNGEACYEFVAPILFAGNKVGDVIVGLRKDSLAAAQQAAGRQTLWIAALALGFGAVGTLVLASLLTAPIKRLAQGVSMVKAGEKQTEIKITSRDELGELTRSFNEMSKVILDQKESLETYAEDLEKSYASMVRILAAALDARDKYTLGHSARVAWLAIQLGRKFGLDQEALKDLEMACFLHDIGKIRIPDLILAKEDHLDDDEYEIIRQHPMHGAEILSLSESLHKYIPAVLHHHEWYNGQGYPHGLKGEEIHLFAQIVSIADSYDAMTSSRPYRQGRSRDTAIEEIRKFRGTQFSPKLVDLFVSLLQEIDEVEEIPFAGGRL